MNIPNLNLNIDELPPFRNRLSIKKKGGPLKKPEEEKTCNICYNTAPASEFLEIDKCKHPFCRECVIGYLDNLITTRKISKLVCP